MPTITPTGSPTPPVCSSGQINPYNTCQNGTCTQVNACGTNDCSACPISCSSGQTYPYSVCQNNTCTQVSACGTTDCSGCPPTPTVTPPVCPSGQINPYNTCQNGTCTQVNACGTNDCSACPISCSSGQTYPYSVCQNNTCTQVSACGTTDCSGCPPTPTVTPSGSPTPPVCSSGQTYPYSVCQNNTCTQVNACGATNCSACPIPCTANVDCPITFVPTFTAKGQVYDDANKACQQAGTQGYAGAPITICAGNQPGGCQTPYETVTSDANGNFTTTTPLTPGSYTAIFGIPSGYQATCPIPPIAVFTVGNASTGTVCQATAPASCDANGDVQNLYFGVSNSLPWMQASGDISGSFISDSSGGTGFTDNIPPTASLSCSYGPYALVPSPGETTTGILNAGSGNVSLGGGSLSSAQSWLVGGVSSPYVYDMPLSGQARTSYGNLTYLISQSSLASIPLSTVCNLSNCQLPANLPSATYTVSGDLTLGNGSGGTYTFPVANTNTGQYVFLVSGKIYIKTRLLVPDGSFVLFSAGDDIHVDASVGESSDLSICQPATVLNQTSTNCDIEGYYSTDKSFYADGLGGAKPYDCPTLDKKLNINGSIVVNAVTSNKGGFYYNRDLCADDLLCPVLTLTQRPNLMLNGPAWVMFPRRVWQEVAP